MSTVDRKKAEILSHETWYVKTDEKFTVLFDNEEWELYISTVNGEIVCGADNVSTSQLKFHNYPPLVRREIFNKLKEYYNELRSSGKLKVSFYNK